MKPPIIAVIACASGTFSVAYILTEPKPEPDRRWSADATAAKIRGWYVALADQARRDYGEDISIGTMGCGIGITTTKPLPFHLAAAAESMDFSLLRQGWRFAASHCFAEPIPAACLGELALMVRRAIYRNPLWLQAHANCACDAAHILNQSESHVFSKQDIGAVIEAARKLP